MSEPIRSPIPKDDTTARHPPPDGPAPRPAALDRPPATWDEAAELADWSKDQGPPSPADDDMSTLSALERDWMFPAPLHDRRILPSGWWILPAAAIGGLFWWSLLGWLLG